MSCCEKSVGKTAVHRIKRATTGQINMFLPPLFRAPKYKPNTTQYTPRKLEALDHWSLVDEIIQACYRRRRLQGPSPGKWLQTYWGPWLLNLFSKYEVWVLRIRDGIIKILRTQDQANRILSFVPLRPCYHSHSEELPVVGGTEPRQCPSPLSAFLLTSGTNWEPLDIWLGGLPKTFQIPNKIEVRIPEAKISGPEFGRTFRFECAHCPRYSQSVRIFVEAPRTWYLYRIYWNRSESNTSDNGVQVVKWKIINECIRLHVEILQRDVRSRWSHNPVSNHFLIFWYFPCGIPPPKKPYMWSETLDTFIPYYHWKIPIWHQRSPSPWDITVHEKIYMQQLKTFDDNSGRICRLIWPLSSSLLKPSENVWNKEFSSTVIQS